ncbi:MAG: hypothetical protein EOP62_16355 [Sphingomonadales bacterium]|nr:MAG: hypothetical protein EOP62_16355 [Sphingomonadales bacterium]
MDWGQIWAALSFVAEGLWITIISGPAQRMYVAGAAVVILWLAFWAAVSRRSTLRAILTDPAYTKAKSRRGPKAFRDPTIDGYLHDIAIRERQALRRILGLAGQILSFGVLLPTIMFGLATLHYQWFHVGMPALVESQTLLPVPEVSAWQLLTYVIDNVLRGGLFDLMEVFRLHSTTVTNNIAAYPYSVGVFIYHLYVEGFLIVAVATAAHAIFLVRKALQEERRIVNAQRGVKS